MTVNYAESLLQENLANAYPYVLYSGALWSNENTKKIQSSRCEDYKNTYFYLLEVELTEIELK